MWTHIYMLYTKQLWARPKKLTSRYLAAICSIAAAAVRIAAVRVHYTAVIHLVYIYTGTSVVAYLHPSWDSPGYMEYIIPGIPGTRYVPGIFQVCMVDSGRVNKAMPQKNIRAVSVQNEWELGTKIEGPFGLNIHIQNVRIVRYTTVSGIINNKSSSSCAHTNYVQLSVQNTNHLFWGQITYITY